MNKKGDVKFNEAVEIIIMAILIIVGVFLLNSTTKDNLNLAKTSTAGLRDVYASNEFLHATSLLSAKTKQGELTIPELLDKYYYYEMTHQSSKASPYENLVLNTLSDNFQTSTFVLKSDIYFKGTPKNSELSLYSKTSTFLFLIPLPPPFNIAPALLTNVGSEKIYFDSLILPSSLGTDYYINVSVYLRKYDIK